MFFGILLSVGFGTNENGVIQEQVEIIEPDTIVLERDSYCDLPLNFPVPFLGKGYIGFKEAMAFKESSGDYFATNDLGYLGKYQFGIETLNLMGVNNQIMFLSSPKLQEEVFHLNLKRNKWILRREIKKSIGKTINKIKITESGILAAAHLAGAGNVKKYLRSNGQLNVEDVFGTKLSNYLNDFSGFDMSSIVALKNPKVNK
ncbi:hypothetical protein [Maribacter sp. HTCC2170]|uniref:hypothetical protein n=1 Tax=Maribacter sp. (strain HTCC2170 / KCCM 42371) TaxID=313603 RepID=UPI00006BD3E7|nr:hypothetical protein [Maribacter sp. HTCC2170]EAR02527.1 lysM domain protein [Maribacter sp. HTCC2170]